MVGGFLLKDQYIVILSCFGLFFVGLYVIINGITGIKDTTTTWAIGLVIWAVAAYVGIKSGLESIGE